MVNIRETMYLCFCISHVHVCVFIAVHVNEREKMCAHTH